MNAKLRIDLSQGLIEAEGSESFLLALYNDFKERLRVPTKAFEKPAEKVGEPASPAQANNQPKSAVSNGAAKSRKKSRDSQTFVKELDLSKGKSGRLKDFYERYVVKTNLERNLVFVYYMQNELDMSGSTDDHVYTCYRNVSAKLPGALRQSLLDTASRNGWIDTSDMANIRLATAGINHLEHDLPKVSADQ
jgi:hypothetical protein